MDNIVELNKGEGLFERVRVTVGESGKKQRNIPLVGRKVGGGKKGVGGSQGGGKSRENKPGGRRQMGRSHNNWKTNRGYSYEKV